MHQPCCTLRSSFSRAPSATPCSKLCGGPSWNLAWKAWGPGRRAAWPVGSAISPLSPNPGPPRDRGTPGQVRATQPCVTGAAWVQSAQSSADAAPGTTLFPAHLPSAQQLEALGPAVGLRAVKGPGLGPQAGRGPRSGPQTSWLSRRGPQAAAGAVRAASSSLRRRPQQLFIRRLGQHPTMATAAMTMAEQPHHAWVSAACSSACPGWRGTGGASQERSWPSGLTRLGSEFGWMLQTRRPVRSFARRRGRGWAQICRALGEGAAAVGGDDFGRMKGDDTGPGTTGSGVGGEGDSSAVSGSGGGVGVDGVGGGDDAPLYLGYIFLDNGQVLLTPRQRTELWPRFDFTWQECLAVQLQALQNNNVPTPDHGIEVLYRFADFNPFVRSKYFGRSLDLGQFERFRRVMHSPPYDTLLNHEAADLSSCLQLSDTRWRQRVRIRPLDATKGHTFDFTLVQRVGGQYDGPKASLRGGAVFICPAKMRAKWRKKRMRRLKRKRRKMRQRSK